MENEIDVSFVMTVYNKEYYLPSVIRALLNQTGLKNPEYIFVDDVSTDKSVEIIREMTKGIKNVKIPTSDTIQFMKVPDKEIVPQNRGSLEAVSLLLQSVEVTQKKLPNLEALLLPSLHRVEGSHPVLHVQPDRLQRRFPERCGVHRSFLPCFSGAAHWYMESVP